MNAVWVNVKISVSYTDECPTLPAPANGDVSLTDVTVGSTAAYSCDIGFELVGNSRRVCQSDGTWSGEDPICSNLSMYNVIVQMVKHTVCYFYIKGNWTQKD